MDERRPWRPKTRADCAQVPRPCPYYGCRYHLGCDVSRVGTLKVWVIEEGQPSCALDEADDGPCDFDALGRAFHRSPGRAAMLLRKALRHLEIEVRKATEDEWSD